MVGGGRTYRLLVPRPEAYRVRNALSNLGTAAERPARLAPTRMVHRMIDHVLALPAVALGPDPAQPAVPAALAGLVGGVTARNRKPDVTQASPER